MTLSAKKINKPTDGNINAYKNYCNIFNKLKRSAKTKYYTEMLNLHKDSIKETWLVLRQALNNKKEYSKLPQKFVLNGKTITDIKHITEQFNNLLANIGGSISDFISQSNNSFHSYLKGNYPTIVFMKPTDPVDR